MKVTISQKASVSSRKASQARIPISENELFSIITVLNHFVFHRKTLHSYFFFADIICSSTVFEIPWLELERALMDCALEGTLK
jgi:hypothetical protein